MRFELGSHLLESARKEIKEALGGKRVYVCMYDYLLHNAFCLVRGINDRLVGNSTTEEECLTDLLRLRPDILFCTETLEVGYGPSLIEKAKTYLPDIKTLIYIDNENPSVVDKCVEARADAVMHKSSIGTGDGDFIKSIRKITNGDTYFPANIRKNITAEETKVAILNELSIKETEVLRFISTGESNKEISKSMVVSENTIKTHVRNILQKLGARDRTQLAVMALRNEITL